MIISSIPVPSHGLTVKHGGLDLLAEALLEPGDDVWDLGGVVLLVPAEDVHGAVLMQVNLGPLTVVLPLAREAAVLEPEESFT